MMNGTLFQYFHWYTPADGSLWQQAANDAGHLAQLGITAVWLPPPCKGEAGSTASGYDIYDLYDLGEFDQKGSVRTKYGTKQEFKNAIDAFHKFGIKVYADVVLNHKAGADEIERISVMRVDEEDRRKFISEPFEIDARTKFTFPGRKAAYSDFIWDHTCFTGVDYAVDLKETAVFSIRNEYGDNWEEVIDTEKGNYDFLMFADIEYRNPAVREEIKKWGAWLLNETGIDGIRIDAVKHISPGFMEEWLDHMRALNPDLFAVGEYWAPGELHLLLRYIERTRGRMSLFDASLHHAFYKASKAGKDYDLRDILSGSLVAEQPALAVTIVDNHDTQPLQTLEEPVEHWFKPLAYAIILLREAGYPCVFYPDLYGAQYRDKDKDNNEQEITLEKCAHLEQLLAARQQFAYGMQRDYFDHPNCIGWTRAGAEEKEGSGCAILIANGEAGMKTMEVGLAYTGKIFIDYLGQQDREVVINESGWGEFHVPARSVAVWVPR